MKNNRRVRRAIAEYFMFLGITVFAVFVAVMIFDAVRERYDGDTAAIVGIMFVVSLAMSLLCVTVDQLRRKYTVNRSVEQILNATEKITAGNFDVRLTPRHSYRSYDDLDVIMENLNRMAAELSKNEVLKSDFISNVSHELKTPLAIIQNYATALKNEKIDADTRHEYITTITQASARLTDLVMNILQLNKLENQKILPEKSLTRLDEALAQTVFNFEDMLEKKQIELNCDFDEITLLTSSSLLEIVWNNLMSNAIKFTPVGGKISISLHAVEKGVRITFSDSGCGMNEETGRRIFDKFYQGDTSHAKEGNGLGLALVKRVIDILGGEIFVDSKPEQGSTFVITLNGDVK